MKPAFGDDRSVPLDADARFVPAAILRRAYVRYPKSRQPTAPPCVALPDRGLELGIVSSAAPEIAAAVSSLLTCSLDDAKNSTGGHLPDPVVARVQREIISPHGVANLWGRFGHRFVLSRAAVPGVREIVATLLVARRKGTIFFLTGRYNNLRHSQIAREVDFDQPFGDDPDRKWFDLFAFPAPAQFKPKDYHHIANFVVAKQARGLGLGQLLLDQIVHNYARDPLDRRGAVPAHSQHLLCGRGFWQIGDPPWLDRMQRLGFRLRWGAESFFIEHDWAPLPPIHSDGRPIPNLDYNRSFGLPDRYLGASPPRALRDHLLGRIPEVVRLSRDPRAKLQYFQTMFDFVEPTTMQTVLRRPRTIDTQRTAPFTGEGAYHGSTRARSGPRPRSPSPPRPPPVDEVRPRTLDAYAAAGRTDIARFEATFPNRYEEVELLPPPSQAEIAQDAVTLCWCPARDRAAGGRTAHAPRARRDAPTPDAHQAPPLRRRQDPALPPRRSARRQPAVAHRRQRRGPRRGR